MTTTDFSTLQPIELREAWSHEALDFTPLLADDPDMTPAYVAWNVFYDTLGLRGAWICREGLIAIGEALKESRR